MTMTDTQLAPLERWCVLGYDADHQVIYTSGTYGYDDAQQVAHDWRANDDAHVDTRVVRDGRPYLVTTDTTLPSLVGVLDRITDRVNATSSTWLVWIRTDLADLTRDPTTEAIAAAIIRLCERFADELANAGQPAEELDDAEDPDEETPDA
jgi:hypothetical protein